MGRYSESYKRMVVKTANDQNAYLAAKKHGVSYATITYWQKQSAKTATMAVTQAQDAPVTDTTPTLVETLRKENTKLKLLVANMFIQSKLSEMTTS